MASVLHSEVVKLLQELNLPLCDPNKELVKCKDVFGAPFCASLYLTLAGQHVLSTDRLPAPRDLIILGLNKKKNNRELIIETLPDILSLGAYR